MRGRGSPEVREGDDAAAPTVPDRELAEAQHFAGITAGLAKPER